MLKESSSLEYPFQTKPEFGKLIEVSDGIFWLRMPIPFSLDHINLWVLKDGDGWALIDTGFYSEESVALWENVLAGHCHGAKITKIIVTHFHPDHVGMAGWLTNKTGAPLHMSKGEFEMLHIACQPFTEEQIITRGGFYQQFGLADETVNKLLSRKGSYADGVPNAPLSYQCMVDGESIDINGESWQFNNFAGHSPEHVCLFNEQRNILISGDQVLPSISPNISVSYAAPVSDPLAHYLSSLRALSTFPADAVVLPSHGRVFKGLRDRTKVLMSGHQADLEKLQVFCQTPRTGRDVMEELFGDRLNLFNIFLAVGEALAHLNCLVGQDKVVRIDAPLFSIKRSSFNRRSKDE